MAAVNLIRETVTPSYVHQFGFPFLAYELRPVDTYYPDGEFTVVASSHIGDVAWIGLIGNIIVTTVAGAVSGLVFFLVTGRFGKVPLP